MAAAEAWAQGIAAQIKKSPEALQLAKETPSPREWYLPLILSVVGALVLVFVVVRQPRRRWMDEL
jgi:hypothetical protein